MCLTAWLSYWLPAGMNCILLRINCISIHNLTAASGEKEGEGETPKQLHV